MEHPFYLYNTLSRKKEQFIPVAAPHVGMYVCGPTVYGDAHLGHARPAITFDILYRYLTHLGYKVRYVRNITDVGHLEADADDGEDKVAKKARLSNLSLWRWCNFTLLATAMPWKLSMCSPQALSQWQVGISSNKSDW